MNGVFFKTLTFYGLFCQAQLDSSRTCVYWNDEIDLASDCIYEYARVMGTCTLVHGSLFRVEEPVPMTRRQMIVY
ncbi:hypothetical protein CIK98_11905 [Prevotella sp. P2-180]|nr:hypothetical protein CIK98_11905 [Prevotella sp. P2-180]